MEVMPEKCPVAPRFKGKAQVITSWGLLSLARNGVKLRHLFLGTSNVDAPAIGLPHLGRGREPANLSAEPMRQKVRGKACERTAKWSHAMATING